MVSPPPGHLCDVTNDSVVELGQGLEEHGRNDEQDEAELDDAVSNGLLKEPRLKGNDEKDGGWKEQ